MADPTRPDNPFDHPYPSALGGGNDTAASTTANSTPPRPVAAAAAAPPQLHLPDDHQDEEHHHSHPHSHDDSPEVSHSKGGAHKRVQWPAELSQHVSIDMASPVPKTLQDQGARDELDRALEQHRQHGGDSPFEPRFIGNSGSEANSRATSSDGDHEERMEQMREDLDVFVDPGETDGLPTVGGKGVEAKAKKAAWGLVKGYTTGSMGFRQRKNAGFKSGGGDAANDQDEKDGAGADADDEKGGHESGVAGFFSRLNRHGEDARDPSPENVQAPAGSSAAGGGGILSALIALQQQQQQAAGGASGATSGATTPTSMAPSRQSSIGGNYSSDEDDDEAERIKFILKQREKRANQNRVKTASLAVSGAGKHLGGAVGKGAMGVGGAMGKGAMGVGGAVVGGAGHALGFASGRHTRNHSAENSLTHTPPKGGSTPLPQTKEGEKKKKGMFEEAVSGLKHMGGLTPERPDAAKSSGGVFGGLMLSTGNLAGAATPAASSLAPNPERPGYHLSRYSAPQVPSLDPPSRPKSVDFASRPGTPDTDSPKSGTGFNSPPLASPPMEPASGAVTPGGTRKNKPTFSLDLKGVKGHPPKFFNSSGRTPGADSPRKELGEYFAGGKETEEQREQREWEKEKRRRRKAKEKRKAQEVFITLHVAAILERQQFIMKMARAFMMFGAPSHRLEAQMQATARVLEINCQVIYIPGVMLVSFGDVATHTSEIKFLKQANGLDLGKLLASYMVYYNVIYDKISVTDASLELDELMIAPPKYKLWQNMIIGGLASAVIQPSAFYGSFIDCLVAIPLGALLVLVQVVVSRNDLYSSLFEIVIACINAFLAAALASTKQFCFAAVASGSVVLILPGYIVLCGSLELANRSIISGSVRLVYSILYSLFLGFGLAMGSEVYQRVTGLEIAGATDFTCSALRIDAPWYRATIPPWFYFLTIPWFLLMLALRNGQPFFRKETIVMLIIGSAGFSGNYFSGKAFPGRSDIVSAIGSFVVGFLGNAYGKVTRGSPFVVMVPGILIQLPSGLSNGGLLQFAADNSNNDGNSATTSYSAGFSTAESLVEVAIGLTVGLFVAAAILNLFAGGGRRRGANLASF